MNDLLSRKAIEMSLELDVQISPQVIADINARVHEYVDLMLESASPQERNQIASWHNTIAVHEKYLRYNLKLELRPKLGFLTIVEESIVPITKTGQPKRLSSSRFTQREKAFDRLQIHNSYARSRLAAELPHSAYPHFRALQQELIRWSFFYFEPRERMREPNAVREIRHVGMMGENLAAFLNTLQAVNPANFKSLELALHMLIPSISGIDILVNDRGEVDLRLLEGPTPIPSSLLSEGTLRLVGLLALASTKERTTLIGFEEPENGIHPRRIRLIAELLKSYVDASDTQLILTTHSPILLDALPRESLYVCRKVAGQTRIRPLTELDSLGLDTSIADGLIDCDDELAVSERVLRGDFDA